MNVEKLQEIILGIEYPILLEVDLDSVWSMDEYTITWNSDGNRFDLEHERGETYSGELPEGFHFQDDYLICNVDTNCGQWVTRIFSKWKEVKVLE